MSKPTENNQKCRKTEKNRQKYRKIVKNVENLGKNLQKGQKSGEIPLKNIEKS